MTDLSILASQNFRQRQHFNVHKSHKDACQRLFNAIEPGSYIRPHRHLSDPKDEMLIGIRGLMAVIIFDDNGTLTDVLRIGSDKYGDDVAVGAEVCPFTWHTVIALAPGSVLFEVKPGPFDASRPKDLASWAPDEGSQDADGYLQSLMRYVLQRQI